MNIISINDSACTLSTTVDKAEGKPFCNQQTEGDNAASY